MTDQTKPAFATSYATDKGHVVYQEGISTRLYLAGQALAGLDLFEEYTVFNAGKDKEYIAKLCLDLADEILRQNK